MAHAPAHASAHPPAHTASTVPTVTPSTRQLPPKIAKKSAMDFDKILRWILLTVAGLFLLALTVALIVGVLSYTGNPFSGVPRLGVFSSAWDSESPPSDGTRTNSLRASTDCPATPEVIVLEGSVATTINPNGRCFVHWAFEGTIDVYDASGRVRENIKGTDYLYDMFPMAVRSHTGSRVVMNYAIAAN